MLNGMSPRQKARAALSVLELTTDEQFVLDEWINAVGGSPITGLLLGVDFRTVEEVLEHFFSSDIDSGTAKNVLVPFGTKFDSPEFREKGAKICIQLLQKLPPNHQPHALALIKKVSSLSFPEFQHDFNDVEAFLRDGLFVFISNNANSFKETLAEEDQLCPHCFGIID